MYRGGCYCGAVKYEIHGRLLMFANCHCPDCRKFTGAAFAPILVTESKGFTITSGEDELRLSCVLSCSTQARDGFRPGGDSGRRPTDTAAMSCLGEHESAMV